MEHDAPMPAAPRLVLYHADCADGFGAAFAAWLKLGDDARYLPCRHGEPPPDARGHEVFILDFSFPPDVLARMARDAFRVTLLDHHLSARRALTDFVLPCPGLVHVDLDRSGAVLAWEHFHPGEPLPRLLRWVQDRDLWRWREPGTRDFLAWLDTLPHEFRAWKAVMEMDDAALDDAITRGRAMNAKFESLCAEIAREAVPVRLCGVAGWSVNAPGLFASRVGNLLAERGGFGLVWQVDGRGELNCSLRSADDLDVSALAGRFGGGGHARAAGFRLPISRLPELVAGDVEAPDQRGARGS